MQILKVKDWIASKKDPQFKIDEISDNKIYQVTRISDDEDFELETGYLFKYREGEKHWMIFTEFEENCIFVNLEIKVDGEEMFKNPTLERIRCQINDLNTVKQLYGLP